MGGGGGFEKGKKSSRTKINSGWKPAAITGTRTLTSSMGSSNSTLELLSLVRNSLKIQIIILKKNIRYISILMAAMY